MITNPLPSIAVIGAGISALVCARTLIEHGFPVQVFDKGRGPGGRMSTRRTTEGFQFDHGAQYFTARDQDFQRSVDVWCDLGVVAKWFGRIVSVNKGRLDNGFASADPRMRFVGTPGMNAICSHLGEGLAIRYGTRVASARRIDSGWQLRDGEGRELGAFDTLVVAVPAPQASELLVEAPALAEVAGSARMTGCWALMLAFEQPIEIPYDGAFVRDSALSWVARNSSKPGRNEEPECWVCHASPEWSEQHLEATKDQIVEWLLRAFFEATGIGPRQPIYSAAHRWRYALPSEPLPERSLFDSTLAIGACGDWCGGPRVEGAFLSGMSVAGRVMTRSGHRVPGNAAATGKT